MKLSKLYNPLMIGLLHSPLHGTVSRMYMVVTFTGRKSGHTYRIPVEYFTYPDGTIGFLTRAGRVWWRNLQGGAAVTLRVRGQDIPGAAEASVGNVAPYTEALDAYLKRFPGREKVFNARRDDNGALIVDNVAQAAAETAIVRVTPH